MHLNLQELYALKNYQKIPIELTLLEQLMCLSKLKNSGHPFNIQLGM